MTYLELLQKEIASLVKNHGELIRLCLQYHVPSFAKRILDNHAHLPQHDTRVIDRES